MYSKSYLLINKYFAFAFVMFAVLSGVTDNYGDTDSAKAKEAGFAYFWNISQLLIQNTDNITAQVFISKYNSFSEYVRGIIADNNGFGNFFNSIVSLVLFFAVICLNNLIMQNNIWRKAVF